MTALEDLLYRPVVGRAVLGPIARWGYRRHVATGETPQLAYRAMRKLFGNEDRAPFAALVARAAADHPPVPVDAASGIAAGDVAAVVAELDRDGCSVLPRLLGPAACDELEAVARAATCTLVGRTGGTDRAVFDAAQPLAIRYDVAEADILASAAAQRLVADPSLLAIAQAHLRAEPVQDLVAMWWSAAVDGGDTSAAAQRYHFDLDRLRFLKVFVFLTDVDDETGPHVYVRGSHRDQPAALRRDHRHTDAAVAAAHPGAERRITGPRGTVFLADTIGLHKGLELRRGHRLVFQTEYATSLFGGPYDQVAIPEPSPEMRAAVARHPRTFGRFRVSPGP